MTFQYPKSDNRKKERITIRIDADTLNNLEGVSAKHGTNVSVIIRDIISKHIKNKI